MCCADFGCVRPGDWSSLSFPFCLVCTAGDKNLKIYISPCFCGMLVLKLVGAFSVCVIADLWVWAPGGCS